MNTKRFLLIFFCFTLLCIFLSGCGKLKLESKRRDREILIDGRNNEWQDAKTYVNDKKIAVGVFNDEDFLYLHVVSWDKEFQRMMMGMGFTVWFDPEGRNNKKFGIRFPVGMGADDPRDFMEKRDRRERLEFEDINEVLLEEMEIVSINKGETNREFLHFFNERGIEAKVGRQQHNIIYELKVPLIKSSQYPYAIGTKLNKFISLCFEIPKPDFKKAKGAPGGGMPGGRGMPGGGQIPGGGGMPGRMPGGRGPGGHMPGGGSKTPRGFELWVSVELVLASS